MSKRSYKPYMQGIVVDLMRLKNIDEATATRLMAKYYRRIFRHWGAEPNTEDFAEKIIDLDKIIQAAINKSPSNEGALTWKHREYKTVTLNINRHLYRKAKSFAYLHDQKVDDVIELALQHFFKMPGLDVVEGKD
ncbi:hypothetical protein [Paenibacillus chibensis]|uniref:hypothetical protein n=1 Tax=Paenibacillus chibensis TaxID=59846 RepID=UPI000FDBE14C|nr:hypothetical protein [Paenibacillus chibensis]MEC0373323.1 hypothetical protein [Paenibacillus chibensis]